MRSMTRLPSSMQMFPCHLRAAGYYATNNAKEDYNLEHTGTVWDESSNKAHWRNRKPGQPFFAVFNFLITHESQLRTRPHTFVHDPAKVRVPAYHPDTPEVREDWAQYYDNITTMDGQAARVLKQLEEDGLADDTVVFFYGDHGSGMPRNKRWPYNSGLQVPLIVHIPEKYKHLAPKDYKAGGSSDRLVSFVDLAPTVLSLADVKAPPYMQGQAFLGRYEGPERQHVFGFRGRMDERYDLVRSVRDKRFVYIRNYMPHKVYGQHLAYMFETPTTQVWKRMYDEGKLQPPKTYFWETKPAEELYDLDNDRDEVHNLASSPEHQSILKQLRAAQKDLAFRIRDIGFLPENELHSRSQGATPYETGHKDELYPMQKVFAAAELASSLRKDSLGTLRKALQDSDSAVRYWAALGILMRGKEAVMQSHAELAKCLADKAPSVQIAASEALGRYGPVEEIPNVLQGLLKLSDATNNGVYTAMMALNALDSMGERAAPVRAAVAKLPGAPKSAPDRTREYVGRLVTEITGKQ